LQVFHFSPEKPNWKSYVTHLRHSGQARWVLDERDRPKFEEMVLLGIEQDGAVVASLTLKVQPIVIPATEWAGGKETVLKDADGQALKETFVQTFNVDEAYRRRGMGELLQREAVNATRQLGCYQMRSWSSLDKDANYQLKLKLGFAAHPAVYDTDRGLQVSGVYFVRKV
jgi:GNAT superfamily N-acetyltransferase